MADIKISAFPMAPLPLDGSEIFTGLVTGPSNANAALSDVAAYVAQYTATLTRTAYVGTGAQYAYQSMFQAWDALGSPLNIVVCTDITEDGDITLSDDDSYLSITHAYNVTVDRGDFSFIAADVSRVTLKINGSFATWNRNYTSTKSSIDFKTTVPEVVIIQIDDFIDNDQSDQAFGTPFITQSPPNFGGFCEMRNVTLQLNNNAISTNELIDASIENMVLVCNAGRDSDFVLAIEGNSKINGVKAIGDFRATTTLMTINKYSTYENVWNLASGQVAVVTSGGHGANIYGVNSLLNVTILGDEVAAISPKVVNANNCSFTFEGGDIPGNSSASIVNADIMSVDNSTLTSGNFKFSNCQVPTSPVFTGTSQVSQWSNCNFLDGYSIDSKNTIVLSSFAGYSDNSGSGQFVVIPPSENSIVIGTIGNNQFTDTGTNTEEGFNTNTA